MATPWRVELEERSRTNCPVEGIAQEQMETPCEDLTTYKEKQEVTLG